LRTGLPAEEPRPAQRAGIRPGAQPQQAAPAATEVNERGANAPLQLPGVITNGPKPGAQAAIRPRPASSTTTPASAAPKSQPPKQQAGRKADAKVTPPKAAQTTATQPKAQPRPQPAQPRRPKPPTDE
jgi:hypothetical protein